jgi:hypothetical protein
VTANTKCLLLFHATFLSGPRTVAAGDKIAVPSGGLA